MWAPYINVYNCYISNGDDNVVVDSNGRFVHVWNCVFGTGHGASIGSFTSNVHDVIYEGITFNKTEAGLRLRVPVPVVVVFTILFSETVHLMVSLVTI